MKIYKGGAFSMDYSNEMQGHKMTEKTIKKFIRPIKRKVHIEAVLKMMINGFLIVSIISLILSTVAYFIPVIYLWRWLSLLGFGYSIYVIVTIIIMYPSNQKAIKATDHLGFHERIITAWELRKECSKEARLQREDMLNTLKNERLGKLYKIKCNYKKLLTGLFIGMIAIGLVFIPSDAKYEASKKELFKKQVEEQALSLEEEKERLYEELKIEEEEKQIIDEKLKDLLEQLKQSQTEEEALKNLVIAKNEIKKLDPLNLDNDLNQLGNSLGETPQLEALASALENKNMEQIDKALEEILEAIENNTLDEATLEALEEAMEQMSSEALSELLDELIEAAKNGDLEAAKASSDKLSSMLSSKQPSTSSEMSAFSNAMQSAICSSCQQLSTESISQLALGQSASGENGEGSGLPITGSSQGDGNNGKGQGDGSGGNGGNQAIAGNGAGEGSTNEDGGYSEENGTVSHNNNNGLTENKEGEYEALYQPEHLGGSSNPTFVQGDKGDTGTSSWQNVDGMPIENGGLVPYTEISANYKEQATQTIQTMDIPPVMKQIIMNYFSNID